MSLFWMSKRARCALAGLAWLLTCCGGCSCTPPVPTAPAGPPSNAARLFDLIQHEEIEEASELLMQDPTVLSASDAPYIFLLKEKDFATLSHTQRTDLAPKVIVAVGQIKTFVRGMMAQADKLKADGKQDEAEQRYEAIRSFGRSLNSPEHLLVLQQMGAAFEEVGLTESEP